MSLPAPIAELLIEGVPAGLVLGANLISFSYRDMHNGAVDEISFSVADDRFLWRSGWFLSDGTAVSAVIGYENSVVIPCGDFEIEEGEASLGAGGDTMTFRALAAYTSKELRTDRSAAYDEMRLKDVVSKIAARHGLRALIDVPDLMFTRLSQSKESDLAFLTRLATDWGCYFTVKGAQLVFMAREVIEAAMPAKILLQRDGEHTKDVRLRRASHGCYSKAELAYLNPTTSKKITVAMEDARVKNGDTLKLDDKVETLAQAERLCAAKLAAANDGLLTGDVIVPGNPLLVAGQVIYLGPPYGAFSGLWLVTESAHTLDSNGYETTLKIKGLANG